MAGLAEAKPAAPKPAGKAVAQCDEESDPALAYMELREQQRAQAARAASGAEEADEGDGGGDGGGGGSDDGYGSDEMGSADRVGGPKKQLKDQKGKLELLPPIDHSAMEYAPFTKDFYRAHPTIRAMSDDEVAEYRTELAVSNAGFGARAAHLLRLMARGSRHAARGTRHAARGTRHAPPPAGRQLTKRPRA
eukprot:5776585-Prymnesium_polylepis.1